MGNQAAIAPAVLLFVLDAVHVVHQPPRLQAAGPRQRAHAERNVIEQLLALLTAARESTDTGAGLGRFVLGHLVINKILGARQSPARLSSLPRLGDCRRVVSTLDAREARGRSEQPRGQIDLELPRK